MAPTEIVFLSYVQYLCELPSNREEHRKSEKQEAKEWTGQVIKITCSRTNSYSCNVNKAVQAE